MTDAMSASSSKEGRELRESHYVLHPREESQSDTEMQENAFEIPTTHLAKSPKHYLLHCASHLFLLFIHSVENPPSATLPPAQVICVLYNSKGSKLIN